MIIVHKDDELSCFCCIYQYPSLEIQDMGLDLIIVGLVVVWASNSASFAISMLASKKEAPLSTILAVYFKELEDE